MPNYSHDYLFFELEKLRKVKHMAVLWKRCAKNKHVLIESWNWVTDVFKARAEKAEAERDALKKDARICADLIENFWVAQDDECFKAARRILAATEDREC
jgi:hypothetical protein